MKNPDVADCHFVTTKINVMFNVLGSLVLKWICRHVEGTDVVTIYKSGGLERRMELLKEIVKPRCLSNGIGEATIL